MKEYKLKINGEIDFIIISPQVLSSLISQNPQQPGVRSCGKHREHHAAGIYRLLIAGYQYQSLYQ